MKRSAHTALRKTMDRVILAAALRKAMRARDKKNLKRFQSLTPGELSQVDRDNVNAFLYGRPEGGAFQVLLKNTPIEEDEE